MPRSTDIWSGSATTAAFAEWIGDIDAIEAHEARVRYSFFNCRKKSAAGILLHPDTPSEKSSQVYQEHVPTKNWTAGYSDVKKALRTIKHLLNTILAILVLFVVGDQQSFSRMVWLKRMEPESYKSIVPFPRDFHAAVHMVMAMHALRWASLICWIVNQTDLSVQSISEEWSSIELYNR